MKNELRNKIGNFVKNQRKASGLNQADLAELVKVSQATVSNMENGKACVSREAARRILEAFVPHGLVEIVLDMGVWQ